MLKAVIFDFDGVIVNSEQLHHDALKYSLEVNGCSFDNKFFDKTLGLSLHEICQLCVKKYSLRISPEDLMNLYEKDFMDKLNSSLTLIEGADELITLLTKNGYKTAIASAAKREYVTNALKKFNLLGKFKNKIATIDMVKNSKPAPDLFLKAAELIHEQPQDCLIIENTIEGIQAAQNAGSKAILLTSNPSNFRNPPSKVISSLHQIDLAVMSGL